MTDTSHRAADLLLAVRRGGQRLADLPADLAPKSVTEAFAVQDAMVAAMGPVGGWKVAAGTGPEPLCSPLPASAFLTSPAEFAAASVVIVEVEVAVKLGRDLPPRDTPYTVAEVEPAIASLHPALELIGSPFVDRSKVDKITLLSDLQSNAAVIIGDAVTDWQGTDLSHLALTLSYDGVEAGSANTGPSYGEVLEALAWLANHAATRNGGLRSGQVIITGSRINRPFNGAKQRVEATVTGLGSVSVLLG